jgi:hypothetical protein
MGLEITPDAVGRYLQDTDWCVTRGHRLLARRDGGGLGAVASERQRSA